MKVRGEKDVQEDAGEAATGDIFFDEQVLYLFDLDSSSGSLTRR